MFDLVLNALTAGTGAFFGALGAYWLAWRKEQERQKQEFLCLLLLVYDKLELLLKGFTDFVVTDIFKSADVPYVRFDMPLPNLEISSEQLQTLMKLSPDKDMASTLIHVQGFIRSHRQRVAQFGSDPLPLQFIEQQVKQLKFMLLSVRTQYEQTANETFPLDESVHT